MTVSPEELAAYADGELDEARAAEVAAAIANDPALRREFDAHEALKAKLAGHFAATLAQPLPENLTGLLKAPDKETKVADFATARARRVAKRRLPDWRWVAGPALAASLALALILPRGTETPTAYAGKGLAGVLDSQLVAEQRANAETRVLLSFQTSEGAYCRVFSAADSSGIACRAPRGWQLRKLHAGISKQAGEYRQAGSSDAELLAQAQAMADGPALDEAEEEKARARNWLPRKQ